MGQKLNYCLLIQTVCYEIETKDIYEELWEDKQLFDNSDYPQDSKFFYSTNKKVIGKFKDEVCPSRNLLLSEVRCLLIVKDC